MALPDGIDPKQPIGEFTDDELISLGASLRASRQWANTSQRKLAAMGRKVSESRLANLTPEERQAIGRKGGRKRARNAGQKLKRM